MKKMLMGFAACALAMTSCSNNEVLESFVDSKNKLSFSVASGKQSATRVAELSTTALETAANSQNNGIALYAYTFEKEVDGVDTTYYGKKWFFEKLWHDSNSDSWEIENDYYAGELTTYTFITYFPTTNVKEVNGTFDEAYRTSASAKDWGENTPKFEYTVQNECRVKVGFDDNDNEQIEIYDNTGETQEDLIVGHNEETFGGRAFELQMGHALSQVNFAIKGYKGVTIEVENIFIGGVYKKGTFTYYSESPLHGTWEVDKDSIDNYVYKLLNTAIPATAETGDLYVLGDGGNWGPGKDQKTFYPVGTNNAWKSGDQVDSTPMDNSLMLMPQIHEDGEVYVFLKAYTTNKETGKKTYLMGSDTEFQPFGFSLRRELDDAENDNMKNKWEQNYRYLYVIDLSNYIESRKISFTVDVNKWENWNKDSGNDGVIDFPIMGEASGT